MAGRIRYRVRVAQAAYLAGVSPSTIRRLYKGDPKAGREPVLSVTHDKRKRVLIDLDELVAACPKLDEAEVRRRLAATRGAAAPATAQRSGQGRVQRGTLPRSRGRLADSEATRLREALQQAEARAGLAEARSRRLRRRAQKAERAADKWEARFFDEHDAVIRLTERTNELQLVITEAIRSRRLDPPQGSDLEAPRAAAASKRAHTTTVVDDEDQPTRQRTERRRRPTKSRAGKPPPPAPTAADTLLSVAAGVVDRLTRGR